MGGHIKCPRIDHVAELPGDWSAHNSVLVSCITVGAVESSVQRTR